MGAPQQVLLSYGGSPDITTGLVAYYPLNESSGNALDASGNSRTMTQSGTVGAGSGATANSRGPYTTSNYFSRTDSAFELNNSDWTVCGWVNPSSLAATSIMFSNNSSSGGINVSYEIEIISSGAFQTILYNTSLSSFIATTANTASTSTWAFFCATYNSATKAITVQLNGGTVATTTLTGTVFQPSGKPTSIGLQGYSGFEFPTNGYLGKLRVYSSRVLDSTGINYLYNGGTFSTAP
jgi:Concanavalin A-like lectin/glucanases superfamily